MGCMGREQWVAVFPLYYQRRSLGGSYRSTNLPPHRPPCVANEPARPPAGNRGPCHIYLTLAPIAGVNRRLKVNRPPEAELWRKFEIARPLILGALLDATLPFSHVPAKTR
jgi:hypothetical protein